MARRRRDEPTIPRALLFIFLELAVFPFHAFKTNKAARRAAIVLCGAFAIAIPAIALSNGNVGVGLGTLAGFGGALAVMIAADRRITKNRHAERERRRRRPI